MVSGGAVQSSRRRRLGPPRGRGGLSGQRDRAARLQLRQPADAAVAYGHGICDKVARPTYGQVMDDVKTDFATTDEYQASYLISQAVNELCPALIWQLRNSAAHYRPPAP